MCSDATGTVLVIGDDMRIFLSLVRAYGRAGKTVHVLPFGHSAPALRSRYIHRIHDAPDYDDDKAGWCRALVSLLGSQTFDLIVPCADPAIAALDDLRDVFQIQTFAIPPRDAMTVLFDKEETHRLCVKLDIPVAGQKRLTPADTAQGLLARFGLPMVLKPRRSFWPDNGKSREDVEIVDTAAELLAALGRIPDRSRYVAEAFFPGAGVGVSVLAEDGEILQAFQHRRLREGRGGCSSYRISEPVDPALRLACSRICRNTRHTGVCMFEFRKNLDSGEWILLEINARFWGSMPLPLSLGLDYPNRLFDLCVHGRAAAEQPYRAGMRSRNFMLDGNNLLKRLRSCGFDELPGWFADVADFAVQPLRWLLGTERSDALVADDWAPALWEFAVLAQTVLRRQIKRTTTTKAFREAL